MNVQPSHRQRLIQLWAICEVAKGLKGSSKTEWLRDQCQGKFIRSVFEYQLVDAPHRFNHRYKKASPRAGHLIRIIESGDQARWASFLAWLRQPELIRISILTADQLLPFDSTMIHEALE